jgi:hypothetical protein
VALHAPTGHQSDNRAFYTGLDARLVVEADRAAISYLHERS